MTRRTLAARLVTTAAACALAGCALGPRPTLTTERQIDDSAIEAVLDRLDVAGTGTFTAVYSVVPTLAGAAPADVTVTHSPTSSMVVFSTAGTVTVEYATVDGEQRTCAQGQTECVAGLDETRISNLGITSSFWGPSTANKLRTDGGRNVGPANASTTTLAAQPATCAAVPVGGAALATVQYCALDAGPLAAYRGADAVIELVSYTPG